MSLFKADGQSTHVFKIPLNNSLSEDLDTHVRAVMLEDSGDEISFTLFIVEAGKELVQFNEAFDFKYQIVLRNEQWQVLGTENPSLTASNSSSAIARKELNIIETFPLDKFDSIARFCAQRAAQKRNKLNWLAAGRENFTGQGFIGLVRYELTATADGAEYQARRCADSRLDPALDSDLLPAAPLDKIKAQCQHDYELLTAKFFNNERLTAYPPTIPVEFWPKFQYDKFGPRNCQWAHCNAGADNYLNFRRLLGAQYYIAQTGKEFNVYQMKLKLSGKGWEVLIPRPQIRFLGQKNNWDAATQLCRQCINEEINLNTGRHRG